MQRRRKKNALEAGLAEGFQQDGRPAKAAGAGLKESVEGLDARTLFLQSYGVRDMACLRIDLSVHPLTPDKGSQMTAFF